MKKNLIEKILDILIYGFMYAMFMLIISGVIGGIIGGFLGEEPPPRIKPCDIILDGYESKQIDPNTGETCELFTFVETIHDKVDNFFGTITITLVVFMFVSGILSILIYLTSAMLGRIGMHLLERDIEKIDRAMIMDHSIEDILAITERMLHHSRIILFGKKLGNSFADSAFRKEINRIYTEKSLKIIQILQEVKQKLNTDIDNTQAHLESAQSDLLSLEGNNDLITIKNLQSIRLDKQIEQFEELQRVLVKV